MKRAIAITSKSSTPSRNDGAIRALRPPRRPVDPWKAFGSAADDERRPGGVVERALTLFLAGAECAFTCSFCDLWQYTIEGRTPPGALPRQVMESLASLDGATFDRVKLYNASNFFDRRAVPIEDWPALAKLCSPFAAVTVESHASMVGPPTIEFARQLGSARLEVAMGLETTHPGARAHLNKHLDLGRFQAAADFLLQNAIDLRVFVLLGTPHIPADDQIDSTVRSVEFAAKCGASIISIIPVRGGNGEIERLQSLGLFTPPTIGHLERALDVCLHIDDAVVTVDLWDIDKLVTCAACSEERIARLRRLNISGIAEPPVNCDQCND
ncbi:MAG: hypothetical protein ABIR92_05010 [Gemmatimonadaceae bacterium]